MRSAKIGFQANGRMDVETGDRWSDDLRCSNNKKKIRTNFNSIRFDLKEEKKKNAINCVQQSTQHQQCSGLV